MHGFFKLMMKKMIQKYWVFNNRHKSGEWKTYDKNGVLVSKLVFDDKGNLNLKRRK